MAMIGILGGMGPLATVDFMDRVVRLTDASCDQEHLPMVVAHLPHTPDRSRSILAGDGAPLPHLLAGIDLLNRNQVGLVVIPCNSSHHWYRQLRERSSAPILHIASTCVAALPHGTRRVAVLATRGALASRIYQDALAERDIQPVVPDEAVQAHVDTCIRAVKAGALEAAGEALQAALAPLAARNIDVAIMGCTEIPVALRQLGLAPLTMIDSTLELARATVAFAMERGWNKAQ
ncbi:aspartate racemase [Cupriavidus sp. TA19]|uniref:aspartate/glutamate racemase family protein n=1 Tax=Cupriavidus sp. TA19 TaxID=701108 RepID=UPI0027294C62|nr:amino acid racemase [Cupriavidus sp. TA19]GLC96244.1 aspartate racemase [Cupriavidus sp. TA19]